MLCDLFSLCKESSFFSLFAIQEYLVLVSKHVLGSHNYTLTGSIPLNFVNIGRSVIFTQRAGFGLRAVFCLQILY